MLLYGLAIWRDDFSPCLTDRSLGGKRKILKLGRKNNHGMKNIKARRIGQRGENGQYSSWDSRLSTITG